MFCMGCGAQLQDNFSFCTQCGKPVPPRFPQASSIQPNLERSQSKVVDSRICMVCGAQVNASNLFCTMCGNPMPTDARRVEPMPLSAASAAQPVEPQEANADSFAYDETTVLPDLTEDCLDTVVQPDLWQGFANTVPANNAPVASGQVDAYQRAGVVPIGDMAESARPIRLTEPPMGDDSDTMVLTPDAVQQVAQAPSAAQRMLQLTRANGDTCALTLFPVTVGKGSDADLIIGDNSAISRVHARILRDGDMFAVEDLGSTNKTFIGDYELPPYTPTILSDGDLLKLANEVLQVEIK